ncbi:MAG: IclR family transcriptional regulator C-terminal domain-containing protein [Bauldia sp.]
MPSFEPVRAILRGFEVLRIVSERGPLPVASIVKHVSLPQPTVIRILETLVAAGYVYKIPETSMFGVAARAKALSSGYDAKSRLVQIAEPLIEDLRTRIGWPSNLATFERDAMTITFTNRSLHGFSIPSRLGARIPLLATGVGRVYLAGLGAPELEALLARLRKSKDRWDNRRDLHSSIQATLRQVRRNGYALADEGYLDTVYQSQIWAVAVPILVDGKFVAGISSLVLHSVGDREEVLTTILPELRKTASKIASQLGAEV